VSAAATRFNRLRYENVLDLDSDEKRLMAERLREIMAERIEEADATDCSRLAWLCLHLSNPEEARQYTEIGLARDSTNQHCLRLQSKLLQS
jgi:hypothetical protein